METIKPLAMQRPPDGLSRQCPLCGGADQHIKSCELDGKEHVYSNEFFDTVNWDETLRLNGVIRKDAK